MCKFTYTHLECGHRKRDHIDTSSCTYFDQTSVHCQPDNREHKERGTTVLTVKRKGTCSDCLRAAEEANLAFAIKESLEAAEKNKNAREEAIRAEKDRKERIKREKEAKEQREEAKRAERRRQEDAEKMKKNSAAAAERRAREAAELEAQMEKENQDLLDRIAREEAEEAAELERKKEAEHQERLRHQKAEHERKLAEKANEAKRLREETRRAQEIADKQRRNEEAVLEWQKDVDHNEEGHPEGHRQKPVKNTGTNRQRHADSRRRSSGYAPGSSYPTSDSEDTDDWDTDNPSHNLPRQRPTASPKATSPPPAPPTLPAAKPTVDYSTVVGHHGTQELGHGMLGNRRIPLHSSQKRPEQAQSPTQPIADIKPAPAPVASLARPIQSSPTDYKIQQPSVAAVVPGAPEPEWKKNIRRRSSAKAMPAPEAIGTMSELEARLAKRREWEAAEEEEALETDPSCEAVGKAHVSAGTSPVPKPTSPFASKTQGTHDAPPPTYPVVPPLAQPNLGSASPPVPPPHPTTTAAGTAAAKSRPPIPTKRTSTTTASDPSAASPIPTPPRMSSLPVHSRVDSAASSSSQMTDKDDSDDEEDRWGESGGHTARKQFSPDDVFGEQRRKGWRAAV